MSWGRESVRDSGDVVGKDTTLANTMGSYRVFTMGQALQ